MKLDIDFKLGTTYDKLLIHLNKSITTLESNYYINNVCLSYSKLVCLEEICSLFLYDWHGRHLQIMYSIEEYQWGKQWYYEILHDSSHKNYDSNKWYDLRENEDAKTFFELFNSFEMPLVYIKVVNTFRSIISVPIRIPEEKNYVILLHDFNINALKIEYVEHHCPPKYIVKGVEDFLKYLITNKREEEIQKIEICRKRQDYLCKDMAIVEKVVSISKILSDEEVDPRIKLYVLNELQVILEEQKKLHEKMKITPAIEHIDLLT